MKLLQLCLKTLLQYTVQRPPIQHQCTSITFDVKAQMTHQWFPSVLIYVDRISTCCCSSGTIGWIFKAFHVLLQMKVSASPVMTYSDVLSAVKETFMSASGPKTKTVTLFNCGLLSLQTHFVL